MGIHSHCNKTKNYNCPALSYSYKKLIACYTYILEFNHHCNKRRKTLAEKVFLNPLAKKVFLNPQFQTEVVSVCVCVCVNARLRACV